MSRKINILLIGNNTPEFIERFIGLILSKGAHIVNIAQNFEEADIEIDITEFNGTSNLEQEVLRILSSALHFKKGLRRQRKEIKKKNIKISWLKKLIKKLINNGKRN